MKIIFAGTPEFAVKALKALIETTEHDVVAVYTQPDRRAGRGKKITLPPVKVLAQEHNIPVYQPITLKDQAEFITGLNADVMVVVAYGMLLPQDILDAPQFGCINIHASILPRWRGAAPIHRAVEAGDKESGVSIMKMELGLDTGPVFQTLTTAIESDDTTSSLHDRLADLGAQGIINTLHQLAVKPDLQAKTQDDAQANYAHKISKEEAEVNWSLSAEKIEQRIRAFTPWPICRSWHHSNNKNNRIRLWSASIIKSEHSAAAGTITSISREGIEIACGKDKLLVTTLQKDGSKALNSHEFLNGYCLEVDDQLMTKADLEKQVSNN